MYCHCSIFRKFCGALEVRFALVERRNLVLDSGADDPTADCSSPRVSRSLCRLCGSAQFFDVENAPDATYIAAATLDGGVHPGRPPDSERHGYVDSMPAWERINGITVHRR